MTNWIDTEQDDPWAAGRFYAGLFGWTLDEGLVASLDGVEVAAIAPGRDGPASWNTYVAVDDADLAAAAGGAARS